MEYAKEYAISPKEPLYHKVLRGQSREISLLRSRRYSLERVIDKFLAMTAFLLNAFFVTDDFFLCERVTVTTIDTEWVDIFVEQSHNVFLSGFIFLFSFHTSIIHPLQVFF